MEEREGRGDRWKRERVGGTDGRERVSGIDERDCRERVPVRERGKGKDGSEREGKGER